MKYSLFTTAALCAVFAFGLSSCKKNSNLPAAAAQGDLETVQSLIEDGADVNAKEDSMGGTAVVEAAGNGKTDVVKALVAG